MPRLIPDHLIHCTDFAIASKDFDTAHHFYTTVMRFPLVAGVKRQAPGGGWTVGAWTTTGVTTGEAADALSVEATDAPDVEFPLAPDFVPRRPATCCSRIVAECRTSSRPMLRLVVPS